jgi:hypothetical protein
MTQRFSAPFSDGSSYQELRETLRRQHGPMMSGIELAKALGFSSATALRRAALTDSIGVRTFQIPGRRGRFALTDDVVDWIVALHKSASTLKPEGGLHVLESRAGVGAGRRPSDPQRIGNSTSRREAGRNPFGPAVHHDRADREEAYRVGFQRLMTLTLSSTPGIRDVDLASRDKH